ncbi:MAG: hypothetical protein ABEK50_11385 [bacterium]
MPSEDTTAPDDSTDDVDDSPEEQQDYREMMDKNFELLKELEHREIIIRSNRYQEEDREYYVEKVEKAFLDGGSGYIPSVRLVNEGVRPSLQPVLKMPRNPIPVEEDGDLRTLRLIYTSEPSVEHSFHYMNKYDRPDLKIFISYEK